MARVDVLRPGGSKRRRGGVPTQMAEHAIHGNYGVKQVVEAEDELASLNNAQGPISCRATQGIEYAKYKGGGVRIMMCVVYAH